MGIISTLFWSSAAAVIPGGAPISAIAGYSAVRTAWGGLNRTLEGQTKRPRLRSAFMLINKRAKQGTAATALLACLGTTLVSYDEHGDWAQAGKDGFLELPYEYGVKPLAKGLSWTGEQASDLMELAGGFLLRVVTTDSAYKKLEKYSFVPQREAIGGILDASTRQVEKAVDHFMRQPVAGPR